MQPARRGYPPADTAPPALRQRHRCGAHDRAPRPPALTTSPPGASPPTAHSSLSSGLSHLARPPSRAEPLLRHPPSLSPSEGVATCLPWEFVPLTAVRSYTPSPFLSLSFSLPLSTCFLPLARSAPDARWAGHGRACATRSCALSAVGTMVVVPDTRHSPALQQ